MGSQAERATAIILAGGKSSRFGADKASSLLLGRPLLQWVLDAAAVAAAEVVIVGAVGQELPGVTCDVPARIVRDRYPNAGPLAGLATGLEAASTDVCLALSCDAPLLQPALLAALIHGLAGTATAAVVPEVHGRLQPLVAAYRRSACLGLFRNSVEAGELALTPAVQALDPLVIREAEARSFDPELQSFHSANTPAELEELRARRLNPKPKMA
jgi:molybdopterin-guanine dinucleotide biosynthesis protein A